MNYIQLLFIGISKYLRKTFSSNFKIWNKIVNDHKIELGRRGFLLNWINELGVIISLTDDELDDLKFIKNDFQNDQMKYQIFQNKLSEFLKSQNEYFLEIGLREIIDDEYEIELSEYIPDTYYITFTHSFGKYNYKFWLMIFGFISLISGIIILILIMKDVDWRKNFKVN